MNLGSVFRKVSRSLAIELKEVCKEIFCGIPRHRGCFLLPGFRLLAVLVQRELDRVLSLLESPGC